MLAGYLFNSVGLVVYAFTFQHPISKVSIKSKDQITEEFVFYLLYHRLKKVAVVLIVGYFSYITLQ